MSARVNPPSLENYLDPPPEYCINSVHGITNKQKKTIIELQKCQVELELSPIDLLLWIIALYDFVHSNNVPRFTVTRLCEA